MPKFVLYGISLLSMVLAWVWCSHALGQDTFPNIPSTLSFLSQEWEKGRLQLHMWATLSRVLISFAIAMVLGVLLGVASGFHPVVDRLLRAWVVLGLTIPRIVPMVLAYLIIGLNEKAVIFSIVLVVLPTIMVQVQESVRSLNFKLLDMARVFKRPVWQVVLPQLLPFIVGSGRATLSLAWKMVVFAEILGRTSGIGYQISFFFQQFEMRGILAYGLAMTLALAVVDGIIVLLGNRAFAWQHKGKA